MHDPNTPICDFLWDSNVLLAFFLSNFLQWADTEGFCQKLILEIVATVDWDSLLHSNAPLWLRHGLAHVVQILCEQQPSSSH